MDAFEDLVASLLAADGWWVRRGSRVLLTVTDKRDIGRPSAPRWELDLIAFKPRDNHLLALECKSFLDSPGVDPSDFEGGKHADRYKLFTEPTTREVVLRRHASDLIEGGLILPDTRIQLGLAAGRIRRQPERLEQIFDRNGWCLLGPEWIRARVRRLASGGYENSIASVVAKVLVRDPTHSPPRTSRPG